jgi:hypothetical protein
MKRPLIIAAALLALGLPTSATANEFAGIVANDVYSGSQSYRAKQFAAQQAVGVGIIRQTLDWASVEVAPNSYDFTNFDHFVEEAARHNIRVLPVLFDPPPFLPVYSGGHPNAAAYVAMLRTVGSAIKELDPNAEIVTAGLPDSRLSKPNVFKYIQQMYSAGAKGTFDTLGINPYAPTASSLISKLKKIRGIMTKNGDGGSSLWVTELGWSDVGPGSAFRAGKSGQAKRIGQALKALKANASALKLRGFFYFAWKDGGVYKGGKDFWGLHTGLLRKNGSKKPAFAAFKKAVAAL